MAKRKLRNPVRFREAARAMRELLRNPEDTSQVFRIVEALSGASGDRVLRRMQRDPRGRRMLRDKPRLLPLLQDRDALSRLPPSSLGRAYLDFIDSEGITAEGLVDASVQGRRYEPHELGPEMEWLRNRMRDTHDVWHVVTGYKGDLIGEASLLAFSFAQTRNPGVAFIVSVALLRAGEANVRKLIIDGYLRGRRAVWLPLVDWESLLPLPLEQVRRRLGVGIPPDYVPVRTADVRVATQNDGHAAAA